MYVSYYTPYAHTPINQPYGFYYDSRDDQNHLEYYDVNPEDQRFFPLLLPFVAGLAIGPLLFNNRPCCPPPYPPYPMYPPPYPVAPPPPPVYPVPYPMNNFQNSFQNSQQAYTPIHGGITENINIITK